MLTPPPPPLQYLTTLLRLILGRGKPDFLPEWNFWVCLGGGWSCWHRGEKSARTSNSGSWYSFLVHPCPSSVFSDKAVAYDLFSFSVILKTSCTLSPSQLLWLWGIPLNGPVRMLHLYWTSFSPKAVSRRYLSVQILNIKLSRCIFIY